MTGLPAGKNRRPAGLIPCAFLVAVTAALYANTLGGRFVWDDNLFAANQVYWRYDLRTIFFSLANGLEYQPVRDLSFLFDIALWGDRPFGFHLTNLLLFTANVLLVYGIAAVFYARFIKPDSEIKSGFVPLLTALLFAVHPLKSEVVAWVTQRNTLLATLFFLAALLCFLRYQEQGGRKYFILAGGAFFLAIFSKATVIILPLLLLLLMLIGKEAKWRRPGFWLPLLPFALLSVFGTMTHLAIARKTAVISAAYYGTLQERVAVALQIPFFYLQKTLLPSEISAFYVENFALSVSSPRVMISAALLATAAAAAWLLRNRFPELLLGGGWFIITLLPVSNLLATSPVVADRYLFLPSAGLAFMAAVLLSRLRLPPKGSVAVAILLLLPLAWLTFGRNRVWHDDIALWSDSAGRTPQVAGIWFNLGRAWHRTPQLGKAVDASLRAVSLDPADIKSLDNAATLFPSSRGSIATRHRFVRDLAAKLPPYPAGLSLLGYTSAKWEHPDAAEELLLNLLAVDSQSTELQLALANLYLQVGAPDRAVAIYSVIVKNGKGRGEAEFGLATIAVADGNQQDALRLLAIARSKGGVPEALLQGLSLQKASDS